MGLITNAIFCIFGTFIFVFIFPFAITAYGFLLFGTMGLIAFAVSYIALRKIFASFKDKPTRLKQFWVSADWAIIALLGVAGRYISKFVDHALFFIGFGYIMAALITKILIARRQFPQFSLFSRAHRHVS